MSTRRMKPRKRIALQITQKLSELPGFTWTADNKARLAKAIELELDWLFLTGRLEIREIAKDYEVKL